MGFDSLNYNQLNSNYLLIVYRNKIATIAKSSDSLNSVSSLFYQKNLNAEIAQFLKEIPHNIRIYSPDPNQIKKPGLLGTDDFVNSDASNLVSFF